MPATVGSEQMLMDYWIYNTLISDTLFSTMVSRDIYNSIADESADYPLVVYQWMAGADVPVLGYPGRVFTTATYQIRLSAGRPYVTATVKPVADRMDMLLNVMVQEGNLTLADSTVWNYVVSCFRQSPFFMAESDANQIVYHTGGLYHLDFQANLA